MSRRGAHTRKMLVAAITVNISSIKRLITTASARARPPKTTVILAHTRTTRCPRGRIARTRTRERVTNRQSVRGEVGELAAPQHAHFGLPEGGGERAHTRLGHRALTTGRSKVGARGRETDKCNFAGVGALERSESEHANSDVNVLLDYKYQNGRKRYAQLEQKSKAYTCQHANDRKMNTSTTKQIEV